MKKTIIALLILGAILITVGGIGTFQNYSTAKKQFTQTVNLSETIKDEKNNQTLNIAIDSSGVSQPTIEVLPSSDEKFHLENRAYNTSYQPTINWEFSEKNGTTQLKLTHEQKKLKEPLIFFNLFGYDMEPIVLRIPKSYQTVRIDTGSSRQQSVFVSELNVTDLTITNPESDMYLTNITTEKLSVTAENSDIALNEVHVEETVTVTTDQGDISLNDVYTKKISGTTKTGDIQGRNLVADTTLRNAHGDIALAKIVGVLTAETGNGDVLLKQSKLPADTTIKTTNGDIQFILGQMPKSIELTATSKLGDVRIFNEEKTSYHKGSDGPKVNLTSANGDIDAQLYDEDNDDNYYDDESDYFDNLNDDFDDDFY